MIHRDLCVFDHICLHVRVRRAQPRGRTIVSRLTFCHAKCFTFRMNEATICAGCCTASGGRTPNQWQPIIRDENPHGLQMKQASEGSCPELGG